MERERLSPAVVGSLIITVFLAVVTVSVILVLSHRQPSVQEKFTVYLEHLRPAPMLVAARATERLVASKEFTGRLLAIFKLKATIHLSVLADITYVLPVDNPSAWKVSWDGRQRVLTLFTPEPECLLPAIHTDSIEIRTEGATVLARTVLQLKEKAAKMKEELSEDLLKKARQSLSDPEVRGTIAEGVRAFARTFCLSARIDPSRIEVVLPVKN